MQVSVTSGSLFNGLAIIGSGAAAMLPDQRWIGALIAIVGFGALVFDIKVDRGHVEVGTPRSLGKRLRLMAPQIVMLIGALVFLMGATWYYFPARTSSADGSQSNPLPAEVKTAARLAVQNLSQRSNDELRALVGALTANLRTFAQNTGDHFMAISKKYPKGHYVPGTDGQRDPEQEKKHGEEWMAYGRQVDSELNRSMRPEAMALREEICRRLGQFPPYNVSMETLFFESNTPNTHLIYAAANYLERIVRQLP